MFRELADTFNFFGGLLLVLGFFGLVAVFVSWICRVVNWNFANLDLDRLLGKEKRNAMNLVHPVGGMLPVRREMIESGQADGALLSLLAGYIESNKPPANVPQSLTYAPKFPNRIDAPEMPQIEDKSPRVEPLSVMECFARGLFNDPTKLLTGFENGNMVYSPVDRTYGVCIAGLPGMGKSNGMRFYTSQMVLHGAQVAIVDPAANSTSGEGLAAAFEDHLWAPMAVEPEEILDLLRKVDHLGRRRDSGQDDDLTPLLLLTDEITSLITDEEYGAQIKSLLMRINRKHRKNKIYTIGSGQDWLSGAQGGDSSLRNTYVCKVVFRIDRMNAGKLLPNQKLVPLAPELREGQAIFVGHDAVGHVIDVPFCPAAAVSAILGQNRQPGSASHTGKWSLPPPQPEVNGSAPGSDREVDGNAEIVIDTEQMQRIRALAATGASTFRIVKNVFGVTGGRGLHSLLEQVNFILGRDG